MTPLETVEAFLSAYWAGDTERTLALAADDFQWVNMPMPKSRVDKAALRLLMHGDRGFPAPIETGDHISIKAMTDGDIVMHERVDRFRFRGVDIQIPCNGVWRVTGDQVSLWRDYYDLGIYLRGMAKAGVTIDTSGWW